MKREQATAAKVEEGTAHVRIRWGSSENLQTIYVNQLAIVSAGAEFYLVFGELPMPPIMSRDDVPEELVIIPKVRLAISPKAMEPIARVIQENLGKFLQKEG
jgi:hypothetical protein